MHPNALLDLTTQLVREVLKLDAPADSIVSYFFRSHKELGQRERHALAETAYAVLRHKGPYANMGAAYRWLYGTWLPASGRSIRDEVMFEAYLNNPREVPPNELLTEICLPLQSVAAAA